jgi:hypothetical protein
MRRERVFLRLVAVGALVCLTSLMALGQASRTWVSGVGDDANPCSRTAPCKTFAGAIGKTATGGEIDVLDPGGFGAVTINKSISIEADGLIAGVLIVGTNGIVINAGPTDVVVLRGLTMDGTLGLGLSGISFISGGSLFVEGCKINAFTTGISITPSSGQSRIFIDDTTVRNSQQDGILISPSGSASVTGTFDRLRLENNGAAGLEADASGTTQTQLTLENSTSTSNATGVLASGIRATVLLSTDTLVGNGNNTSTTFGGQIQTLP